MCRYPGNLVFGCGRGDSRLGCVFRCRMLGRAVVWLMVLGCGWCGTRFRRVGGGGSYFCAAGRSALVYFPSLDAPDPVCEDCVYGKIDEDGVGGEGLLRLEAEFVVEDEGYGSEGEGGEGEGQAGVG